MIARRTIRCGDVDWPPGLNELGPAAPQSLIVAGDLPLDEKKAIAIVGTRRPTAAGAEAARRFSRGLAEAGFTIVSGLAVGIDAVAHRAALDASGQTVAVLGTGIDIEYPSRNARLRRLLTEHGTLVTEFPDGTPPLKSHFPQRNRIIVGLTQGVLVVEGGLRSGALITARLAIDANRHIWAVPGSLRNPMSSGPNELIRTSQAQLVTEVNHILDDVAPGLVWQEPLDLNSCGAAPNLSVDEREVLSLMDDLPIAPDRICMQLRMVPGRAALALARLEVRGLIVKCRTGYELSTAGARVRAATEA